MKNLKQFHIFAIFGNMTKVVMAVYEKKDQIIYLIISDIYLVRALLQKGKETLEN